MPPYDCTALYSSTDTLLASPQLTSPPIAALFSPNSALRYSHQSNHSISYDVTPPKTTHSSSSSQLQDGGLLPTRRCSLLPTLCNTKYHSIRRHQHFLSFFPKIRFSKFLGALSRGLLPLIFEFPYSPYISPHFFPTFDHYSHFLLHGTAKRLNYKLIRPSCSTHAGVPNPGTTPYMARALLSQPMKRWSLTSTVTPTPPLYSFFNFSPKSMVG